MRNITAILVLTRLLCQEKATECSIHPLDLFRKEHATRVCAPKTARFLAATKSVRPTKPTVGRLGILGLGPRSTVHGPPTMIHEMHVESVTSIINNLCLSCLFVSL
jgi:hypothetical protein